MLTTVSLIFKRIGIVNNVGEDEELIEEELIKTQPESMDTSESPTKSNQSDSKPASSTSAAPKESENSKPGIKKTQQSKDVNKTSGLVKKKSKNLGKENSSNNKEPVVRKQVPKKLSPALSVICGKFVQTWAP